MSTRLLTEDGFDLLTEDGADLLLETTEVLPDLALLALSLRSPTIRGGITLFDTKPRKAVIQAAIGTTNGNNRDFRTPTEYVPGTTKVFLNGFLLSKDLANGWVETGNNWIQMKEAPLAGDSVQIYFSPL